MRKKDIIFCIILLMLQFIPTACRDDYFMNEEIGEGNATLSVTLCFDQEDAALGTTRAEGGDEGNAIQNINSLCMLFYDTTGKLVHNYIVKGEGLVIDPDVSGWSYNLEDNRIDEDKDEQGNQFEDSKTGTAMFKLRPIKRGKYYIYAVANMGDLTQYKDKITTREGLKAISLQWDPDDISQNSEMFGVFSLTPDRNAPDDLVTINSPGVQLHSWLRRAASKVTVAFDGSGLYANVQIYIENVILKDIPKTCSLGNPNTPGLVSEDVPDPDSYKDPDWKPEMHARSERYTASNGLYSEGKSIKIQKLPADLSVLTPENYIHICNDLHRYMGKGEEGDEQDIITNTHAHKAQSLFFYENMQGKGKSKKQSQNGVDIDYPDPDEQEEGSGWKDEKPYGTYVEVTGYYRCTAANEHVGAGPIKFRFMLGQDVTTDYNATRNTHYKLTLKFKGYGNDADWHIEYEEPSDIYVSTPQYISYLYNKSMNVTLKVVGEIKPNSTLDAEILGKDEDTGFTGWRPWGNGTSAFPTVPNDFYYSGWIYNDGPWNSFLSLRKTSLVKIVVPGYEDKPSWQTPINTKYNETYYNEKNKGNRSYKISNIGADDLADGEYSVKSNGNEHIFTIPLYTRAKELVTKTGFTGNNPYSAYPRKERIKFTIQVKDDVTGTYVPKTAYLDMIQVRRIENPKGVWRSAGNSDNFHVTLMRLPYDDAEDFKPFNSEGAWSATIVEGGDDFITLRSTVEGSGSDNAQQTGVKSIEGAGEHPIDFWIDFKGTIAENSTPRCAIVRVRYHNYTCEHDIYVRQGYAPITIDGNAESDKNPAWASYNVYRFDANNAPVYTKSPLEEGSLFRRGNRTAILASNNDRPGFTFGLGPSGSFDVLELGATTPSQKTWSQLAPSADDVKSRFASWSIAGDHERIATIEDFYTLESTSIHSNIGKAYGVLYGDGATETQKSVEVALGYDHNEDPTNSKKGMRGCFVFNINNSHNIFFPIGKSGYGRRKGMTSNGEKVGALRYAQRTDYYNNDGTGNIQYVPLFYDLFERPGAIYQCRNRLSSTGSDVKKSSAFDINYFTMGFEGFENGASNNSDGSDSDACFIRTVKY